MRLPINHIKTSSINKDTITSNSVSDFIVGSRHSIVSEMP